MTSFSCEHRSRFAYPFPAPFSLPASQMARQTQPLPDVDSGTSEGVEVSPGITADDMVCISLNNPMHHQGFGPSDFFPSFFDAEAQATWNINVHCIQHSFFFLFLPVPYISISCSDRSILVIVRINVISSVFPCELFQFLRRA